MLLLPKLSNLACCARSASSNRSCTFYNTKIRALVQRNKPAVGRAIIKSTLKENVTDELVRVIGSELAFMCSQQSLATLAEGQLQSTAAVHFSWESLYEEIQQLAPTLEHLVSRALPQKIKDKGKATLCMVPAMLLKRKNKNAAFLQSLVSVVGSTRTRRCSRAQSCLRSRNCS